MPKNLDVQTGVADTYRKRSSRYDGIVKAFNLFRSFGFDIDSWREESIQALQLKPSDTVVDLGCGTGLLFHQLYKAVGPQGKIIGVDLSQEMLGQAQQRIREEGWDNIELVCADATKYTFPPNLNAIISNYAPILIPDVEKVVANGCKALTPGGRFSILDMAWPNWLPIRWWRLFFWLKPLGLTREILNRKPWEAVWRAMEEHLEEVTHKRFWFGFMYQINGVRSNH